MTDDPRHDLIVALGEVCEAAINETSITPSEILESLCTTIAWVIANTQPEHHEGIRRSLTAAVAEILRVGRDAQVRAVSGIQ